MYFIFHGTNRVLKCSTPYQKYFTKLGARKQEMERWDLEVLVVPPANVDHGGGSARHNTLCGATIQSRSLIFKDRTAKSHGKDKLAAFPITLLRRLC
jgi:hypothetical protein